MARLEFRSSISYKGLDWSNAHHLPLVLAPNVLNPAKLLANLRNPVNEFLHTSHKQYPVELKENTEYHLVEHRLGEDLVTVDIVVPQRFASGYINRARQLFETDFYYGHDKYFPQPFRLIDRTFVSDGFDVEEYIQEVMSKQ